jgi:hypothetical protein
MKTSDSVSFEAKVPSLFQIAAFFEDVFPPEGLRQSAKAISHLPIADYVLNPEKLLSLLGGGTQKNSSTITPPAKPRVAPKRGARSVKRKTEGSHSGGPNGFDFVLPKKIEFLFKAPGAMSVKLAGDFTDWESHAIDMMFSDDGTWFTVVPLMPGTYSYRFIVDGEWHDDPSAPHHMRNPFGTQNAVIHVT